MAQDFMVCESVSRPVAAAAALRAGGGGGGIEAHAPPPTAAAARCPATQNRTRAFITPPY